jgi:drug/metabolite transporter (DMT)-like permease
VLWVQVLFAGWLGLSSAVAQPSFDAITQRNVAPGAQGRTFARFAVRQQLLWVLGALIPAAIAMRFSIGDRFLALLMFMGSVIYSMGRRVARR